MLIMLNNANLITNSYALCLRLKNVYLREEGITIFMNGDEYAVHICNFIFECLWLTWLALSCVMEANVESISLYDVSSDCREVT